MKDQQAGRARDVSQVLLTVDAGGSGKGMYDLVFRASLNNLVLTPQQLKLLVRSPAALAALARWHQHDQRASLEVHAYQLGTTVEDIVQAPYHGPEPCRIIAAHGACLLAVRGFSGMKLADRCGRLYAERIYPTANYPDQMAGGEIDVLRVFACRQARRYRDLIVVQVSSRKTAEQV